ncbi:hypothetical protein MNB_SM-3-696 [hydrothermal vent metagenome]|uniref:Uncharacterized protein n=1 Tax=hydrothermal vent metagenome TaxID=652676 RepID=A0A1W1D2D4_9ZZZZ
MQKITQNKLIIIVSLFLVLFDNVTFFSNLIEVYSLKDYFGFVTSVAIVYLFFTIFLFGLLSTKWTIKPIFIIVLLVSSLAN